MLPQVWSAQEKPVVEEIYKLMHSSQKFANKVINLYEREQKKAKGLDEYELNSYCWDQLRLEDCDKDDRRIAEVFAYFKKFNERNPLRLREMFNQWHGL